MLDIIGTLKTCRATFKLIEDLAMEDLTAIKFALMSYGSASPGAVAKVAVKQLDQILKKLEE